MSKLCFKSFKPSNRRLTEASPGLSAYFYSAKHEEIVFLLSMIPAWQVPVKATQRKAKRIHSD